MARAGFHVAVVLFLCGVSRVGAPGAPDTQERAIGAESERILRCHGYEVIKLIAEGGFGAVFLARDASGRCCAVKKIKKEPTSAQNAQEDARKEPRLMSEAGSCPFVANLYGTIESDDCLLLVMEYVSGGELTRYIEKGRGMGAEAARFVAAEVVLALKYLHERNILYKDIKPGNIIVARDGHIKLVDLGISSKVAEDRDVRSGTPGYMAPECLQGAKSTKRCDFWSLGCLIAEMLSGTPAFGAPSTEETNIKTLDWDPNIPAWLDESARDILRRLLMKNPEERLGSGGIHELTGHRFFADIDWKKLERLEHPAREGWPLPAERTRTA